MSRHGQNERVVFLFSCLSVLLHVRVCVSVGPGQITEGGGLSVHNEIASNTLERERIHQPKQGAKATPVFLGRRVIVRDVPPPEIDILSSAKTFIVPVSDVKSNSRLIISEPGQNIDPLTPNSRPIKVQRISRSVNDGFQADFQGFDGHVFQGAVHYKSLNSTRRTRQWLAMRPLLQCERNLMQLTATGRGYTHLLVERKDGFPISVSHLPPRCGFSLKTLVSAWVMTAHYDGCYVTKENGSYVLPLLWLGQPMKLSCPVQPVTPPIVFSVPSPTGLCSPVGMVIHSQISEEAVMATVGVKVNGSWVAFVAADCAHRVHSESDNIIFFIPYTATCVTTEDGHSRISLFLHKQKYILSCPVHPPPRPPFSDGKRQPAHTPDPMTPGYSTGEPDVADQQHPRPVFHPNLYSPELPIYYPHATPTPPHRITRFQPPKTRPVDGGQPSPESHDDPVLPVDQWMPPLSSQPITCPPNCQHLSPSPPPPRQGPHYPSFFPTPYPALPQDLSPSPPPPPPPPQHGSHNPSFFPTPYPALPQDLSPSSGTLAPPATLEPRWTSSPGRQGTRQSAALQCLPERFRVFLPAAHPESIRVRDRHSAWLPLASVSPVCRYMLQTSPGSGLIFHSPLPACYSKSLTPTTMSMGLKYRDLILGMDRTLELHCPFKPSPAALSAHTPAPPTRTNASSPCPEDHLTSRAQAHASCLPAPPTPPVPSKLAVYCYSQRMTVELPPGPVSAIVVKDMKGSQTNLRDAPEHCGYSVTKGKDWKVTLNLPYKSCHMTIQDNKYRISVIYMTASGRREEAVIACPVSAPVSTPPANLLYTAECDLPSEERLPCGVGPLSHEECLFLGCCYSKMNRVCYYPMDVCTLDRHFVFSVPAFLTEPRLSLNSLVAAGDTSCTPQKITHDNHALFKIPLDGCGTRRYELGKVVVYMVEIINTIHSITQNYGTITRDSPVRMFVECRYMPGSVVSEGYLVKSPTMGPAIQAQGEIGVQLRIAKDALYNSFHPQYHAPLQMLLGKPLFLEVRLLNPPDPSVLLLVHFCVAYPRSGLTSWVLLYNGCPNPLDPVSGLPSPPPPPHPQGQTRRFVISTFQFLHSDQNTDPLEEIYFMCSTEVCSPRDGPCVEGCFGQ